MAQANQTKRRVRMGSRRRRRGSLYLSVVGVAFIVSIIALSAMHVARLQLKAAVSDSDRHRARLLAQSAVEHAIAEFNTNPNWQTDYAFDVQYPTTPPNVNGNEFVWKLADLGNGQRRLDGIGRAGDAEAIVSVNLGTSDDVLQCGLLCGGAITVWSSFETLSVVGAPICTNDSFTNYGTVNGDVEAQSSAGASPSGTLNVPGPVRALPDPMTVFDFYMTKGTVIPNAAIPTDADGNKTIDKIVLSPQSNPFGTTNPDGIYIIDQPGVDLSIKDCRIVGTIVVRNPGFDLQIQKEVNWEPAHANLPALLAECNLVEFVISQLAVSEADVGVNLNPVGTPFQGATDTDTTDSYPSAIAGVVYVTGNVLFDGKSNNDVTSIEGVLIVGGTCLVDKTAQPSIEYDPTFSNDPPPGFGTGNENAIVAGSWRRTPSN